MTKNVIFYASTPQSGINSILKSWAQTTPHTARFNPASRDNHFGEVSTLKVTSHSTDYLKHHFDAIITCCDSTKELPHKDEAYRIFPFASLDAEEIERSIPIILVLTKCDLIYNRRISKKAAIEFAITKHICAVIEISALLNINIDRLLRLVIEEASMESRLTNFPSPTRRSVTPVEGESPVPQAMRYIKANIPVGTNLFYEHCLDCHIYEKNSVFHPCGHFSVCPICADSRQGKDSNCPECHQKIETIEQIF
jgi:hypothetical protein